MRISLKMTAVFLCAPLFAGCASTSSIANLTGGDTAAGHAEKEVAAAKADKTVPTDLEGGIRQAKLLRQAGQYDQAVHLLSQLMLVAADDPRVVGEYGKSLAQKGRAQDAVDFLNRAIELSPTDWTLYSAAGVAYDQLGNQLTARAAYEHALLLKPNEPSVLNNYALSRMLANDPDNARQLIAKAEAAGGASDAKIAANIALLNKLAPATESKPVAKTAEAAPMVDSGTAVKPATPVTTASLPPVQSAQPVAPQPVAASAPAAHPQAAGMPHAMVPPPVPQVPSQPQKAAANPIQASGVVMRPVPVDPKADPVKSPAVPAKPAAPQNLASAPSSLTPPRIVIANDKPAATKPADGSPAKPTGGTTPAATVLEPPRIVIASPASDSKPATKIADAKPATAPAGSDAKPVAVKATSKDDVPALRLTADARTP